MVKLKKPDYLTLIILLFIVVFAKIVFPPPEKEEEFWDPETAMKLNECLIYSLEMDNRMLLSIPYVTVGDYYIMTMLGVLECTNPLMKDKMTKCDKDAIKSFIQEKIDAQNNRERRLAKKESFRSRTSDRENHKRSNGN